MTQSKEAIAKAPESRPRRSPLGRKQILSAVGKDPNFEYRYVTDEGDRIAQFMDAGWQLESKDKVKVGDKRVESASAEGSNVQVSVGQGRKGFLMRIPRDWYAEDQAAKQKGLDEAESSMKRDIRKSSDYGEFHLNGR